MYARSGNFRDRCDELANIEDGNEHVCSFDGDDTKMFSLLSRDEEEN